MNHLKLVISCDKPVKDVNHLVCSREEIHLNTLFRESACVFVAQSCPALCDPMNCSPPGSSVQEILQARILEYIAIAIPSFLTQRLNLGIQHWRQIHYWLSHPGSPVLLLFSHSVMSDSLWLCGLQQCPSSLLVSRLHCPSLSSRVCSDPHPLNQWCHPTISSSVIPFSPCLQVFPALGSFPMSRLFASGS